MRFSSLGALVQHLAGAVVPALEKAEREGLRDAASMIAAEAERMIGREDNGWPDLAESTIEEKRRLGFTGSVSETDPLLRTGAMRDSITVEVDGHVAEIGSPDPVAKYQEFGTEKIPPRPFLSSALLHKLPEAAEFIGKRVADAFGGI